jgi:peroxiredoxin
MTPGGAETVDTETYFSGRKVVMFSVPGAFTPTCSNEHLPGFIANTGALRERGIDAIACLAVNDVFVMDAWGRSAGAEGIDMLADGNGDFTRALGLETDASAWGMGMRGLRFALVAEDGVVSQLYVEAPGEFRLSAAEYVLARL